MSEATPLETRAGEPYAYLTTIGRRTGQPHRIEIWFAVHNGRIFLMAGGRERADWLQNLIVNAQVWIELDGETYAGTARIVPPDAEEDLLARDLLVDKYATAREPLVDWKRRSLPVVIDIHDADANGATGEGVAR